MEILEENLRKLRLTGMLEAFKNQLRDQEINNLSFGERFMLLIENEIQLRENNRLKTRLKKAKLRQNACMQNIDFNPSRELDKIFIKSMENCQWIKSNKNILIVGATGTGKTFLGESLAHNACMKGYTAHYLRLPRFFNQITITKADGTFYKRMEELSKYDVLLMDDFALNPLNDEQRRDFLELIEERHGRKSTVITSQLPINLWHESIGDTTIADAILDRILHNAHRIELKGDSMRKNNLNK